MKVRIARKMSAVLRYCPSAKFPARFSQSAVGWKYSDRVSNYRRPLKGADDGGVRRCVTGWFTECVPRNAYRGNHTCVTRNRGAHISSSYYRSCVRLHCCTWRGCNCVAVASHSYHIAGERTTMNREGWPILSSFISPRNEECVAGQMS